MKRLLWCDYFMICMFELITIIHASVTLEEVAYYKSHQVNQPGLNIVVTIKLSTSSLAFI